MLEGHKNGVKEKTMAMKLRKEAKTKGSCVR